MTKMTKREMFQAIGEFLQYAPANMDATPEGLDPNEFLSMAIQFCDNELALIAKRANAPHKATALQRENVIIKQNIAEFLTARPFATATEIAAECGISVQKASALVRQMVAENRVYRVTNGKKTIFTVYDPE